MLLSEDKLFTSSVQHNRRNYRFLNGEKNQVYYISIVTV